ncbi:Charged multivesicular body protein 6 [Smittium mucronatum]|uniref:Charged multivesicular body protein 6 n=1 Tax=Smittium mucronatum TaxID=133383 RepID=A0A1R0H3R4_9FUNG|nr:Charged multivesicular body protein 6 [Smittium mucronatum]
MGSSYSKNRITEQEKAILDVKSQRDKLQQYQKRILIVTEREKQIAITCLKAGDKNKALLALKKKKYQEQLIEKTNDQLLNLQQLLQTIEFSVIQSDVLKGLNQGTQVLKSLNNEMNLDNVEKLLADTSEAIEYQNEVSDLLQTNLTSQDEEQVMVELESLQRESINDLNNRLPNVPKTTLDSLPAVPESGQKLNNDLLDDNNSEPESQRNEPLLA